MADVLVTGASGFIGRRLCAALRDRGDDVRALLRSPAAGPWHTSVMHELGGRTLPARAISGVDIVFHLAGRVHCRADALDEEAVHQEVNVEGTRRLLDATRPGQVRRFVYVSSTKAMGEESRGLEDESCCPRPETPYGRTKLEAEKLVLATRPGGPEGVVLRLPAVYGKEGKGNIAMMLEQVFSGRFPSIPDFGDQHSFAHVADVVRALLVAGDHPNAVGRTYIVTTGEPVSSRVLYETMCRAVGRHPRHPLAPAIAFRLAAKLGDALHHLTGRPVPLNSTSLRKLTGSAAYSSRRLNDELGFASICTLQEGLEEMLEATRLGKQAKR